MGWNQTRTQAPKVVTHEGGRGFNHADAMSELYLLAANSLMISDQFYETKDDRLDRFRTLVGECLKTKQGKAYVPCLAVYLRNELNLRSIPTMLVTEALQAKAPLAHWAAGGVWVRGDEHLEALAYLDVIGQKRTKNFLRAVATRVSTLSEKQAMKYASGRKSYSQKDAICLAHPNPGTNTKVAALLKYIRKGWGEMTDAEKEQLPTIAAAKSGKAITWEQKLSAEGQKGEEADKKKAWEEIIPDMGYMALLRNLRNIHQETDLGSNVAISDAVVAKLTDELSVRRSKQLPFRFLTASRTLSQTNIPAKLIDALSTAMDMSVQNVPAVDGDTVVVVDMSGSMSWGNVEGMASINYLDLSCLLAAIWVRRNGGTVVAFSNEVERVHIVKDTPVAMGAGIIRGWKHAGSGTHLGKAVKVAINHKPQRIIMLTDEQSHDDPWTPLAHWLDEDLNHSAYVINFAGFDRRAVTKHKRLVSAAGWNEAVFRWIAAMEEGCPYSTIMNYMPEE